MAYTWNGHPIAAPLTFESDRDIWTVEKLNKSIDRGASNAQRWKLSFAVTINKDEDDVFLMMATSMEAKQTMIMPSMNGVKNRAKALNGFLPVPTNFRLNGASVLNSNVISVNSDINYTLPKGTFVQFGTKPKVYVTTTDTVFTSGVPNDLNIFPRLKESSVDNATVQTFDQVILNYYIDDTMTQGITYSDGVLTGIDNIQLIEAI